MSDPRLQKGEMARRTIDRVCRLARILATEPGVYGIRDLGLRLNCGEGVVSSTIASMQRGGWPVFSCASKRGAWAVYGLPAESVSVAVTVPAGLVSYERVVAGLTERHPGWACQDVAELAASLGVEVSAETVRRWRNRARAVA